MPNYPSAPSASDMLAAMRAQGAYVDITPDDAEELFRAAHRLAVDRLRRSVLVRDLMAADVVTLAPDMEVRQAARLLAEAGVSGAPVLEGGAVAGVVSVKDFLSLMGFPRSAPPIVLAAGMLSSLACDAAGLGMVAVATIMSAPALTIGPGATAFEAAQTMAGHSCSRLPVTEHGRLVGIISRSDLIRAFGDMLLEAS